MIEDRARQSWLLRLGVGLTGQGLIGQGLIGQGLLGGGLPDLRCVMRCVFSLESKLCFLIRKLFTLVLWPKYIVNLLNLCGLYMVFRRRWGGEN